MTALAMIIGMVPMALGLGEGGEQNAPLGRAVIGGLMFATVATLFFVPTVFSLMHRRLAQQHRFLGGESCAPGRIATLQDCKGAVRWRDHGPKYRHRHAD
jgi:hypothetical protein